MTYDIGGIYGGSQNIGPNGQIFNGVSWSEYAALAAAVAANRNALSAPEEAKQAVKDIGVELAKPQPDRDRVGKLLTSLTAGSATVTAVTLAVDQFRSAFFGG